MLKRSTVTILGLTMSLIVVGCSSDRAEDSAKPKAAAPSQVTPEQIASDDGICDANPEAPKGEAAWLAQLPGIIQFKFREDPKEGVVAEPVCVRDREHTPDWDDVVTTNVLLGDSFEVGYGRSIEQLNSTARFAKLMELNLRHQGKRWSGKIREASKRDGFYDQALDYFLPLERDITLPSCTAEDMTKTTEVPRASNEICNN